MISPAMPGCRSGQAATNSSMDLLLEETDCPTCGGRGRSPVIEAPAPEAPDGPRFSVVRCGACGLCYTSPRPRAADMARFYPAGYAPHRAVGCVKRTSLPARGVRWWRCVARALRDSGKVLEASCRRSERLSQIPFLNLANPVLHPITVLELG